MTPAAARAIYAHQIGEHGELITLRRVGSPNVDKSVLARVSGYQPEELVGPILQGDRKIIVLAEDVESAAYPTPFRPGFDKAIVRGAELTMQAIDDSTRRVAGTIIAYEIRARG